MDDSWAFRTERGRAWVADGRLRTAGSARGLLRQTYHERWRRASDTRKVLAVASVAATAGSLGQVASALRSLAASGSPSGGEWILLAAFAFVAVALARKLRTSRSVPTAAIESVDRDGRSFRVEYVENDERRAFEFEALTETDADEAAEALRLKGVPVDGGGGRRRARPTAAR